jgi:hypothetical protein
MMKKLAVTVFVLSLSAVGCGSDNGGKKDAAPKMDVPSGAEVQQDVPAQPETQPPTDTAQPDQPIQPPDTAVPLDTTPMDQAIDEGMNPLDGPAPVLDGGIDVESVDAGMMDAEEPDMSSPGVDGGIDSSSSG